MHVFGVPLPSSLVCLFAVNGAELLGKAVVLCSFVQDVDSFSRTLRGGVDAWMAEPMHLLLFTPRYLLLYEVYMHPTA